MEVLEEALGSAAFDVVNTDYPSTDFPVEELAERYVSESIDACGDEGTVHFVTHSMGGILLRYWLEEHAPDRLGRAVLIAPPNQGSELVDKLGGVPGFKLLNGPAGLQLGTAPDSVPNQLGSARMDTGVIAGSASFNPIYSWLIPGDDDGKVSIERARLAGAADFIVMHHTHTFIMRAEPVLYQVEHFLKHGSFDHAAVQ